jgi:hypothetical protein
MCHYKKTIIWTKKSKKGRQEWARACKDAFHYFYKLKTPMKTRLVFKINICEKQIWSFKMPLIYVIQRKNLPCKAKKLTTHKLGLWQKKVSELLTSMVMQCMLNQSIWYWLHYLISLPSSCVV